MKAIKYSDNTILVLTTPPPGGGAKKFAVARPIYVSNSHTIFGLISILSNGLGGDGKTDRQTDGGNYNIPFAFKKK